MITAQTLKTFNIFIGADAGELNFALPLLSQQNYHAGGLIYSANDPAEALHLLLAGEVIITHKFNDDIVTLARLAPGYFFGESGFLIPGHRHQTYAQAVSDAVVLKLTADNFLKLKTDSPALALRMLARLGQVLSERLTENSMRIGILSQLASALNEALVAGDIGRLAQEILRIAAKAANCQKAFLGLYQKYNSHHLKVAGTFGLAAKELPRELPVDTDPYLQKLLESDGEITVPAERYGRAEKMFYAKRNLLARSIKIGREEIGALVLADKNSGDFTTQNSLILEIIASQAAFALGTLAAQEEKRAKEELEREYVGM